MALGDGTMLNACLGAWSLAPRLNKVLDVGRSHVIYGLALEHHGGTIRSGHVEDAHTCEVVVRTVGIRGDVAGPRCPRTSDARRSAVCRTVGPCARGPWLGQRRHRRVHRGKARS